MTSQSQLYERIIDRFLAALDQLESPERSAAQPGEREPLPVAPALMGDREMEILEEAIADIERVLSKSCSGGSGLSLDGA